MPAVRSTLTTTVSADQVWQAILASDQFPSYMTVVRNVTILASDGQTRRTSWEVLLRGSVLQWVEQEQIDAPARRLEFNQVSGDMAYMVGWWQVSEVDGATTVELHVDFDIGIPLLADMLNPLAERALRENAKIMLNRLESRAGVLGAGSGVR